MISNGWPGACRVPDTAKASLDASEFAAESKTPPGGTSGVSKSWQVGCLGGGREPANQAQLQSSR